MVKSAENGYDGDRSAGFDRSPIGRILAQREIGAGVVVVVVDNVGVEHVAEMVIADPISRSTDPFCQSDRCDRAIANPDRAQSSPENLAIGAIVASDQVAGCFISRERHADLACDPFGVRVARDAGAHRQATIEARNDESVEKFESDDRNDEEIDRRDLTRMVPKEGAPALRRRSAPANHVLRHRVG